MNTDLQEKVLDFRNPDKTAFDAARLILVHIGYEGMADQVENEESITDNDVRRYIEYMSSASPPSAHYALVSDQVIAAARVTHGRPEGAEIKALVVRPEYQGQGHAHEMIRFLASQALQHGDTQITAVALDTRIFRHLGFRQTSQNSVTMYVPVDSILHP